MRRYKHPIRIGLGVIFLILAIVGALIPVMQGWIFLLLALAMFFPAHPRVTKLIRKIEPRWPRFVRFLRKLGVDDEISVDPPQTPL